MQSQFFWDTLYISWQNRMTANHDYRIVCIEKDKNVKCIYGGILKVWYGPRDGKQGNIFALELGD